MKGGDKMELIMPTGVCFSSESELPNACYCQMDYNIYYTHRTPNDNCFHCGCGCEDDENNSGNRDLHAVVTWRASSETGN